MSDPSQPVDPPEPEANQNEDPSTTTTAAAASTDQPDEPEPGIRARAFREVLKRALNQTLKGCTFENVAQCFPTAAKSRSAVLKDVHKQLIGQYEKQSEINFELIMKNHKTNQKLNELDDLIDEAKARKAAAEEQGITEEPIPPSTLPPTAILDAHLTPHLLRAQTLLVDKLKTVQSENEQLMDTIEKQEVEIRELVAQLEKVLGGVEGAVKVVQECVGEGGKPGVLTARGVGVGRGKGIGTGDDDDVEMADV